jgi:hypothetical protein
MESERVIRGSKIRYSKYEVGLNDCDLYVIKLYVSIDKVHINQNIFFLSMKN